MQLFLNLQVTVPREVWGLLLIFFMGISIGKVLWSKADLANLQLQGASTCLC